MSLRLGDTVPDFTAATTEGTIRFYEYLGDSWGYCFRTPPTTPRYAPPNWAVRPY